MLFLDIVVAFDELIYSVDENSRLVQPILVLSNPLTTDITIQVLDNNDTAASELYACLFNGINI